MIISVIVPDVPLKEQDNYLPKLLGCLLGTYGHTVNYYSQGTIPVKASDKNLFIWLGVRNKFKGFANKYSKHGISVGYDNTQAWINVDNAGIRLFDSFYKEYNILAKSFNGRIAQKDVEDFYDDARIMDWLNDLRPDNVVTALFHWAQDSFDSIRERITGKSSTFDPDRWLFDQDEPAYRIPKYMPIQNKYAYGIMLFVRDYLEEFLKPYSNTPI